MQSLKTAAAVCFMEKTCQDHHLIEMKDTVNIDGTVCEITDIIKRNADVGNIFLSYRIFRMTPPKHCGN